MLTVYTLAMLALSTIALIARPNDTAIGYILMLPVFARALGLL